MLTEYLRYLGLMLGGGAVNLAVYSLLAWIFPQGPLWLMLYVAAGTLVAMTVNYLSMTRLLYRQRTETEPYRHCNFHAHCGMNIYRTWLHPLSRCR
ncbi:hypothetical protein [Comamonas sp. JC664]|uniref:hypothetical protein n=1 Tax=Comamonas sp. JC664 TaxID=2801917 RepID=UPI00361E4ACD